MMTQYHPDKVNNLADDFKELVDKKTKEINEKYEALLLHLEKKGEEIDGDPNSDADGRVYEGDFVDDGNFEGYADRDKLRNDIDDAKNQIRAADDVPDDVRVDMIVVLSGIDEKLKCLTSHDITREVIENYRKLVLSALDKGLGKEAPVKLGGLVGFIVNTLGKLFRSKS